MAAVGVIHLDTHVLVWLHAGLLDRFSAVGRERLEACSLRASPIVQLELEYLFETGRVTRPATDVVQHLSAAVGLELAPEPFADVVRVATLEHWTRDPFDRIVVAHARLAGAPLLTKDRSILEHVDTAFWA